MLGALELEQQICSLEKYTVKVYMYVQHGYYSGTIYSSIMPAS